MNCVSNFPNSFYLSYLTILFSVGGGIFSPLYLPPFPWSCFNISATLFLDFKSSFMFSKYSTLKAKKTKPITYFLCFSRCHNAISTLKIFIMISLMFLCWTMGYRTQRALQRKPHGPHSGSGVSRESSADGPSRIISATESCLM